MATGKSSALEWKNPSDAFDYKELLSESEVDEFDNYIQTDANPAEAFLTGRAARSEINLKDLNPSERKLFDQGMAKEWNSWLWKCSPSSR
jgi:hypothetical protein